VHVFVVVEPLPDVASPFDGAAAMEVDGHDDEEDDEER
jgi:hypothetical protein